MQRVIDRIGFSLVWALVTLTAVAVVSLTLIAGIVILSHMTGTSEPVMVAIVLSIAIFVGGFWCAWRETGAI